LFRGNFACGLAEWHKQAPHLHHHHSTIALSITKQKRLMHPHTYTYTHSTYPNEHKHTQPAHAHAPAVAAAATRTRGSPPAAPVCPSHTENRRSSRSGPRWSAAALCARTSRTADRARWWPPSCAKTPRREFRKSARSPTQAHSEKQYIVRITQP
jgi:hypothetical protein